MGLLNKPAVPLKATAVVTPPSNSGFKPPEVAPATNVVNTQGAALPTKKNRTSLFINASIPAGATVPFAATGTQFYVLAASAAVNIRPSKGSFNLYNIGQGLDLDETNAFSSLEVQNTTANPVAVSIFVGFDSFIDNTLILNNATNPSVAYPTYPTANAAATINIVDLSGTEFTDINGKKWIAVNRVAILIFNLDTGTTYLVQKSGSAVSNGPAIAVSYPSTAIRLDITGNYTMATGGGNINAIVSEIYNAIPSTS